MASLISLYKERLNLSEAQFTFIDHEDAMVAAVFKISQPGNPDLILKVCSRKGDFLRESYFLSRFAGKIPVPKIIQLIEQEAGLDAAVLMECVQGDLLKSETVTNDGPCVIHRDFRPGNLIASDGKVRGIIDWSSGRGGFAEDDFCPLEFGEWLADCKSSFLEGYASIRKVPDYKPMMPLLRLSRAVAAVGFTVKRGTWESRNSKLYKFSRRHLESLAAGSEV